MNLSNVFACELSGCSSYDEVLEPAPCPPPGFYSDFAEYALGRGLCMNVTCEIAKRCMGDFLTKDSFQIIDSICSPTTTASTTTPTESTTTSTSFISSSETPFTPSSATETTTVFTTKTTATPVPPVVCNSVCLTALIVPLFLVVFIAILAVVLFKCRRNIQIGKWASFKLNRIRRTDRRRLFVRQQTETQVSYDNPNFTLCVETKETLEIQERTSRFGNTRGVITDSRISKTEVDLHIKADEEEVILNAIITDDLKQHKLGRKELVELDMQEVMHDRSSSKLIETCFGGEKQDGIPETRSDPTDTASVHDIHRNYDTSDSGAITAQTKSTAKDKTKENFSDCFGDATETIKQSHETRDDEASGTSAETTDEEDIQENKTDMFCKTRDSKVEVSDIVLENLENLETNGAEMSMC